MKSTAWKLGIAGLIPFVMLPLMATLNLIEWYKAVDIFTLYSGLILSFLGGIHWYDALCGNPVKHQIYVAMLPTLIGLAAITFLPYHFALKVLSLGFLLLIVYEQKVLSLPKESVIWYAKLRMVITSVVVVTHGWVIIAITH